MTEKPDREKVADIIRDAGCAIVGRTRLQKIAYLLELSGLGEGFYFVYHHYGPYSEKLSDAVRMAVAFDLVEEEERPASWGGTYSVFTAKPCSANDSDRSRFAREAAKFDAIDLELAATAAYLYTEDGYRDDPWGETKRRKPEKATPERLDRAKAAYRKLCSMNTPRALPVLE